MRIEFTLLALTLFLAMLSSSVWADETQTGETNDLTQSSNIEGWHDNEEEDDRWTFFGMGYEERMAGSGAASGSGSGGGAMNSVKKGGSKGKR